MKNIKQQLQNKIYSSVFESVGLLGKQFLSSFEEKLSLPESYKSVENSILSGMGGSALGAHIFKALDLCSVPFDFYNGYTPPNYVNSKTLFIASSYSGNTEETVASLKKALQAKAKIIIISAGGELDVIAKTKKLPLIKFNTRFNPSGQPRYGLGYGLGALFNIFLTLGLCKTSVKDIKAAINISAVGLDKAKALALAMRGYSPVLVGADFLYPNAHILANQINETCKTNAYSHALPELNHHLMEGLKRPNLNQKYLKFIFLESELYDKKIKNRIKITKDVVKKNGIEYYGYKAVGETKLAQALDCLFVCGLASLILSIMYRENPTSIPWVDYFKNRLKKMP